MTTEAVTTVKETRTRSYISFEPMEWFWPLVFLLGLSMIGLRFPVGWLVAGGVLLTSWQRDRYDFMLMLMFLLGGYALTNVSVTYVDTTLVMTALAVLGVAVVRKNIPVVRQSLIVMGAYTALLLCFAMLSEERLLIQSRTIMRYSMMFFFVVPLILFSGREFDMDKFMRKCVLYALILCAFYVIDGFIINGFVLIPRSWMDEGLESVYYDLIMRPLSTWFPRKYPPGLYILALCIYPLTRVYKLRLWQFGLVILALLATRTFTFITGVIVMYVAFQGSFGRLMKYAGIGVALLVAAYAYDASIGVVNQESGETTLRVKSSIDQLFDLNVAEDDEDFAETGSGRIAQMIPKVELLYNLGREWIGMGFLDRTRTTMSKYIIENDYYGNPDERIEVATGVEITPVQVFLTIGWLGLAVHIAFFVGLWWIVRRLRYGSFFLAALLCFAWWGLGGFEGLITQTSLLMLSMAYGAVILANKPWLEGFALPNREEPEEITLKS